MTFGDFLTILRKQSGYTQQDVSDLLNLNRSTYCYYENGKSKPNYLTLQKIAKLYDLTVDDLVGCRMTPHPMKLRSPDPIIPNRMEDLQFFRSLNKDEKSLVMLFRICPDKADLLNRVRQIVNQEYAEKEEMQQNAKDQS